MPHNFFFFLPKTYLLFFIIFFSYYLLKPIVLTYLKRGTVTIYIGRRVLSCTHLKIIKKGHRKV